MDDPRGWGFEVMGPTGGNGFGQYLRYVGFCWPVPRSLVGGRLFTAVGIKPHDNPSHSAGLAPG
jgi:hypothetical protein